MEEEEDDADNVNIDLDEDKNEDDDDDNGAVVDATLVIFTLLYCNPYPNATKTVCRIVMMLAVKLLDASNCCSVMP